MSHAASLLDFETGFSSDTTRIFGDECESAFGVIFSSPNGLNIVKIGAPADGFFPNDTPLDAGALGTFFLTSDPGTATSVAIDNTLGVTEASFDVADIDRSGTQLGEFTFVARDKDGNALSTMTLTGKRSDGRRRSDPDRVRRPAGIDRPDRDFGHDDRRNTPHRCWLRHLHRRDHAGAAAGRIADGRCRPRRARVPALTSQDLTYGFAHARRVRLSSAATRRPSPIPFASFLRILVGRSEAHQRKRVLGLCATAGLTERDGLDAALHRGRDSAVVIGRSGPCNLTVGK